MSNWTDSIAASQQRVENSYNTAMEQAGQANSTARQTALDTLMLVMSNVPDQTVNIDAYRAYVNAAYAAYNTAISNADAAYITAAANLTRTYNTAMGKLNNMLIDGTALENAKTENYNNQSDRNITNLLRNLMDGLKKPSIYTQTATIGIRS